MTSNHKLSALLKSRTVAASSAKDSVLTLTFNDGSTMTVQIAGDAPQVKPGGVVSKVQQSGTTLVLIFADDTTLTITTAEATSSVLVRDHAHVLEYAD